MRPDLVIGLDSSTTATKAIAWDRDGRAVAEGRATVALSNPEPGWFEQDPSDWWQAAASTLRAVTEKVAAGRFAALGISNQRESYGYFDESGEALRPATLWLDERSRPQIASLSKAIGPERIHQISGKPGDVTPCLYRFAWFAEHQPEIPKRAHMAAEVHGFLTFKLTGDWTTSTAAADPMGLLDMAAFAWSRELVEAVGYTIDRLPKLRRPGEIMGTVSAAAAGATGLPEGLPVVAAGGDGQCAGTGVNALCDGRAYVNLGTAVVSGSFSAPYVYDRAFRTLSAVAEEGYILESCIRTGTFLVNWLVEKLFNLDPASNPDLLKALEDEAAAIPPGSNGVVLLPYWSGSMTPYWNAHARGAIAGLTSSHGRGDVYRALLEGVALEQAMMTGAISAKSRVPIDHFIAMGGGAASDLWCQILADATGLDVRRSGTVEASSLGAGIAATAGAGWYPSVSSASEAMASKATRIFAPDAARCRRYQELGAIYRDLWPALESWNARLSAFAGRS